ncbi:serpin family protein [Halocatena halophila]|uniref:serpin family protein n=1 Tax=Halocatena halophila TaxID=2814576 RepID=UPI002ED591BD
MSLPTRRSLLYATGSLLAGTALAGCLSGQQSKNHDTEENSQQTDNNTQQNPAGMNILQSDSNAIDTAVDSSTRNRLVRGNTAFALTLHKKLAEADNRTNFLLSPHSISVALAMTYAGSNAKTRSQIRETLQFRVNDDRLHHSFATLSGAVDPPASTATPAQTPTTETTSNDGDGTPFTLETVNSVWGQRGFPWRDTYLDTLAKFYGAGLNVVDFENDYEAARTQINEWVSEQTAGKIQELFPRGSLHQYTRLVLTNAVYFHANWEHAFANDRTENKPFTALDDQTSTVPMMVQSANELPYAEENGVQAVELPYVGDAVGMVILLPEAGQFRSFEQKLDADRLQSIFDSLTPTGGTLSLPKFSFETSVGLTETLSSLGMANAFDRSNADFTGMYQSETSDGNLFIDDIKHKTHIAVDESGTEAAAATGVSIGTTSAPVDPYEMTVDRPFLFCIRHQPTNAILFVGRVGDAGDIAPDK